MPSVAVMATSMQIEILNQCSHFLFSLSLSHAHTHVYAHNLSLSYDMEHISKNFHRNPDTGNVIHIDTSKCTGRSGGSHWPNTILESTGYMVSKVSSVEHPRDHSGLGCLSVQGVDVDVDEKTSSPSILCFCLFSSTSSPQALEIWTSRGSVASSFPSWQSTHHKS